MVAEKQKTEESDDDGNDLPDVEIQAPQVAQTGKQPNACDHKKRSPNALLRRNRMERPGYQPSAVGVRMELDPDDAVFVDNERCVQFSPFLEGGGRDTNRRLVSTRSTDELRPPRLRVEHGDALDCRRGGSGFIHRCGIAGNCRSWPSRRANVGRQASPRLCESLQPATRRAARGGGCCGVLGRLKPECTAALPFSTNGAEVFQPKVAGPPQLSNQLRAV